MKLLSLSRAAVVLATASSWRGASAATATYEDLVHYGMDFVGIGFCVDAAGTHYDDSAGYPGGFPVQRTDECLLRCRVGTFQSNTNPDPTVVGVVIGRYFLPNHPLFCRCQSMNFDAPLGPHTVVARSDLGQYNYEECYKHNQAQDMAYHKYDVVPKSDGTDSGCCQGLSDDAPTPAHTKSFWVDPFNPQVYFTANDIDACQDTCWNNHKDNDDSTSMQTLRGVNWHSNARKCGCVLDFLGASQFPHGPIKNASTTGCYAPPVVCRKLVRRSTPAPTMSPVPPTVTPTGNPSQAPTDSPSSKPSVTATPTDALSSNPSVVPTGNPSQAPTDATSSSFTFSPSSAPTDSFSSPSGSGCAAKGKFEFDCVKKEKKGHCTKELLCKWRNEQCVHICDSKSEKTCRRRRFKNRKVCKLN